MQIPGEPCRTFAQARLQGGVILQGGVSFGRTVYDKCDVVRRNPQVTFDVEGYAAGVLGEELVSAPHGKSRYDRLWATQRRTGRDPGWHRTGDLGRLDREGRLWIEGRLRHVITGPEGPLGPVGLEQRALLVPGVHQAAAVGVGPAGTQATVLVVVAPGHRLGVADPALSEQVREAEQLIAKLDQAPGAWSSSGCSRCRS